MAMKGFSVPPLELKFLDRFSPDERRTVASSNPS
jgi:hypothetical protein